MFRERIIPNFCGAGISFVTMRKNLRIYRFSPAHVLLIIEAVLLYFFVSYISVEIAGVAPYSEQALAGQVPMSLVFVGLVITANFALGLYDYRHFSHFRDLFLRLSVVVAIFAAVLAALLSFSPGLETWRGAIVIGFSVAFAAMVATRWAFVQISKASYLKRRILVVGVGDRAARIETLENAARGNRFVCSGFIDVGDQEPKVASDRIVGHLNSIVDWVRSNEIDEIVVAPDDRRGRLPLPSLIDCRLSGTPIIDHQRFWERETRRVDLAALKPDWFVYSEGFASGGLQRWAKRVFDIAVSASMLLLLSPVLALTALAIFLEDGGPAIYRQERVGFRGRRFTLMKLRSMRVDAEADGPKWADQNDCRVTLVGAFIRKTRIDELPQLINVLKGDMSLVGPRPERPFFVDSLKQLIPYYELRHCVKPGVTGWAQLNYPYGASIEDAWQKLEYDLYYIRSNNVFWDFLILLQTGRVVIWPKGVR